MDKKPLDIIKEELNLGRKHGIKIYKPVFVGALLLIILLFGLVVIDEGGFQKKLYASCSLPEGQLCENPHFQEPGCIYGDFCNVQFFNGEIGTPPGNLYKSFPWYSLLIIVLAVVINVFLDSKGVDNGDYKDFTKGGKE